MEKILFTLLIISFALSNTANARDPDLVEDFKIPPSMQPDMVTGEYFTYTGLRPIQNLTFTGATAAIINKVSLKEFTTLDGQGVSCDMTVYPPSGSHMPHMHPRSAELLLVLDGNLTVGFVDTNNKVYSQTLQTMDTFVIPRGLMHFQMNDHAGKYAVALSMYGSGDAGTVNTVKTLFGSGLVDPKTLAKAFKMDVHTIKKLMD